MLRHMPDKQWKQLTEVQNTADPICLPPYWQTFYPAGEALQSFYFFTPREIWLY